MTTSVASAPGLAQSVLGQPPAFPDVTGGAVPVAARRGKRHPILFLIDTSGSTGSTFRGGDADIDHIHKIVTGTFRNLRYPASGSDLEAVHGDIDASLITYSDPYKVVVPWTMATNLDPDLRPFVADGGTSTGAALQYGLGYIGHRLRYYKSANISHSRPLLLHYTDGAPTDMKPGSPEWQNIQSRLARLNPDPERRFATIRHLISANGAAVDRYASLAGASTAANGIELLSQLSGPRSVLALDSHPDLVIESIDLLTNIIEGVTNIFGAYEPDPDEIVRDAVQDLKHIKPIA